MIKTESQDSNSITQKMMRIVSQMVTMILVQFFIMCIVGVFFGMGPESTKDGWIEMFTISPILSVFLYHYYLFKKQYVKILAFSLMNIALLIAEIYFYIKILQWDVAFGFMIIVLAGVLIPINYLLLKLLINRKNKITLANTMHK